MKQEQKQKSAPQRAEEAQVDEAKDLQNEELSVQTEDVLDKIDDLLEDDLLASLDEVLEENAEEFVLSYIQQGGE